MNQEINTSIEIQCDNCEFTDFFTHDELLAVGSVYQGDNCRLCGHDADQVVIASRRLY